jgi:hypothetical protein
MKEVRDTKEEEGEIKSKEEEEEGNGRAERADEQEEGENEPALIRSQSAEQRMQMGWVVLTIK